MTFKNTSDKDKAFVDFLQQTRSQALSSIVDLQHASSFMLRSCLETNQSACVTRMFDL